MYRDEIVVKHVRIHKVEGTGKHVPIVVFEDKQGNEINWFPRFSQLFPIIRAQAACADMDYPPPRYAGRSYLVRQLSDMVAGVLTLPEFLRKYKLSR